MKVYLLASETEIKKDAFIKATSEMMGFGAEFVSRPEDAEWILIVNTDIPNPIQPPPKIIHLIGLSYQSPNLESRNIERYNNWNNFLYRNYWH